jgi:hypothetical protein
MIGAPSQIPNEPGGLPQLPLVLSLLGAAFLVFFAGLAVLDSGRNLWGLALLALFAAAVAGAALALKRKR